MGCGNCNYCDKCDSREGDEDEIECLREELSDLRDDLEAAEAKMAAMASDDDFKEKVAALVDWRLPINGKEYLILYQLEDILKEYHRLKGKVKGDTSMSESIAIERTPDDRDCGRKG